MPHSSLWFPADCAVAIVYKNHFFCLYQQNKSSESKVKFRQATNCCKALKPVYANKPKESVTFQKLDSQNLWPILNSVLNKVKSAIPSLFSGLGLFSSASDKAKLFVKTFKNSDLEDSGISLPAFLSRTNLKLHNISVTPKMVEKVVTRLESLKTPGSDCISVVVLKDCEP